MSLEKIQQTRNVIEADARATRLLYQQNDAAFATVLEELVTRFDEQLEREKELTRKHESAVESNAKMHGHALCAVQESANMLMNSRDKLKVVRAECQAASSSLSTQHTLVVEQVTKRNAVILSSFRERTGAAELQRQKALRPRPTVRQASHARATVVLEVQEMKDTLTVIGRSPSRGSRAMSAPVTPRRGMSPRVQH
jgi:hypothetical protein